MTFYEDEPHLADKVLKELQHFPTVSRKEPEKIREFLIKCRVAIELAQTETGRSLLVLDRRETQNMFVSRLDENLIDS